MTTYYKFLHQDNHGPFTAFNYNAYLPRDGQPGPWLPTLPGGTRTLVPCERGYHFCTTEQMIDWLDEQLYEVEPGRATIDSGDKCAATRLRFVRHIDTWNERTARLFAADCVERVLSIYETIYPADHYPRWAVEAVRAYAKGEIDTNELEHARTNVLESIDKAREAIRTQGTSAAFVAETAYAATLTEHVRHQPVRHVAKQAREAVVAYGISLPFGPLHNANQLRSLCQATLREQERTWQTTRLLEYLHGEVTT